MRAISRRRRRTRLRATALPTLRLTVKPTRTAAGVGGSGSRLEHETGHGAAPPGLDAQEIPTIGQSPGTGRGDRGEGR